MTGIRNSSFARLAASAAAAALLVGGCAMGGSGARPSGLAAKPLTGDGKAVAKAEQSVLSNPRDAQVRAALGAAYLNAGRFESAATAFNDALNLGDQTAGTVLGLTLAETAEGNYQAALELLRDFRSLIPAGDLGLAHALAGDTATGVAILEDALRQGDATAKTRQNLAFAYALNGQWRESQLMAAQDVPANQVNARLLEWARLAHPAAAPQRVASLIGVTPVADSGQPQALALANFPSTGQLAAEAQAQVAAPEAPAEQVAIAAPAPEGELPAVEPVRQAQAELPPAAAPVAQPITLAAYDKPAGNVASDAPAFVSVPSAAPRAATLPQVQPRKVGKFVPEGHAGVQPGKARGLAAMAATLPAAVGRGTHWVQLGSYESPAVARDGWGKFTRRTPALKNYHTVTTTAVVNGVPVWRVAATGFASYADARTMCAAVRAHGGACLVKRAELDSGGATSGPRR